METQPITVRGRVKGATLCELMWMRNACLLLAGVLASAALVVTNKVVLERTMLPGSSAALTLVHYLCTLCYIRGTTACSGVQVRDVYWPWLILISSVGTLGVWASNMVLKLSNVTFHQLTKLSSVPVSAAVDYFLWNKSFSSLDGIGLVLICYGVLSASRGEVTVSLAALGVAFVWITTYVATAVLIRHVCKLYAISTSEFMYLSAPWGVFFSCVWLCTSLFAHASGSTYFRSNGAGVAAPEFITLVSMNAILAVLVQWLSAWTARNSSTVLYAVMGQAKTAVTILPSVPVFGKAPSLNTSLGLALCVVVAISMAINDSFKETLATFNVRRRRYASCAGLGLFMLFLVLLRDVAPYVKYLPNLLRHRRVYRVLGIEKPKGD